MSEQLATVFRFQFRGEDYPGRRGQPEAVFVWLGDDAMIEPALKYSGGGFPHWVPEAWRDPISRLWLERHTGAANQPEPTSDIDTEIARLRSLRGEDLDAARQRLLPVLLIERALLLDELARVTADTTSSKPFRQRYRETSRELAKANHHLAAALGRVRELERELAKARHSDLAEEVWNPTRAAK